MAINYTYPVKGSPSINDGFLIIDSEDSNATKQVTISSVLNLDSGLNSGVSSFNTLTGDVTITAGDNVTLTTVGNNIEISATGGGGGSAITATAPLTGGVITTSGTVGITQSSVSTDGYLSKDDWATFNNKFSSAGGTISGNVTLAGWQESPYEFRGDLDGATRFTAVAGENLSKGDIVYLSGNSGDTVIVSKADASSDSTMPAFGFVLSSVTSGNEVQIVTAGNIHGSGPSPLDTTVDSDGISLTFGDTLYVSATTPGGFVKDAPTGESSFIQNIGKVVRRQGNNGIIKVGGAGRTNAAPNLNSGKVFVGNANNQSQSRAVSGDATLSNTGALTVTSVGGSTAANVASGAALGATSLQQILNNSYGYSLLQFEVLTQNDYDLLGIPDPDTIYFIV